MYVSLASELEEQSKQLLKKVEQSRLSLNGCCGDEGQSKSLNLYHSWRHLYVSISFDVQLDLHLGTLELFFSSWMDIREVCVNYGGGVQLEFPKS